VAELASAPFPSTPTKSCEGWTNFQNFSELCVMETFLQRACFAPGSLILTDGEIQPRLRSNTNGISYLPLGRGDHPAC
jgi:hypothetical protein